MPFVARDDPPIRDGDSKDVGRQVLDGGVAIAHGLAIDHPGLAPDGRIDVVQHPFPLQRGLQLLSIEDRQGLAGQKEVDGRRAPLPFGVEPAAGNDIVEMRMIVERATPGMERRQEAHVGSPQTLGIGGQRLERLAGSAEHGRVRLACMAAGEGAELLWHGEGDQEVVARQEPIQLAFTPTRALAALARRTVTIAAAAPDEVVPSAAGALIVHGPQLARTAVHNGPQYAPLLGGHRRAVAFEIGGGRADEERQRR